MVQNSNFLKFYLHTTKNSQTYFWSAIKRKPRKARKALVQKRALTFDKALEAFSETDTNRIVECDRNKEKALVNSSSDSKTNTVLLSVIVL
jgi:hypothetical protein